jgi:hypothetical protein
MAVNEFRHERTSIDTSEGIHANASAWGIVKAGGAIDYSQRYAAFRAYHLSRVIEIDDTSEMAAVPTGSVYYLWRVYLGHAYEEVVSGDANKFTASVRASFPVVTGAISSFTQDNSLQSRFVGRGMLPKNGRALFAATPAEIQSAYTMDGPDVPIFVEYRQLPATLADRSIVPWFQPFRAKVRFTNVYVVKDGSWGSTIWSIDAWCEINGQRVPQQYPRVKAEERVEDGNSYSSIWEQELLVVAGDEFRCGTTARIHDAATELQSAGEGATDVVTAVQGVQRVGVFSAGNAKAAYQITWAVDVR